MAPKGKGKKKGKGNSKKTKSRALDPIFKPEIISNILSWLPVKSLLRFRCICREWRKIISKFDFIATHFRHSSSLQRTADSSIIIQTRREEINDHVLIRYKPTDGSVELLDNPYPCAPYDMSITGPLNGILCIFRPIWGDMLTLWNPAMRMSKMVKLSETNGPPGEYDLVSVGLAFDSQAKDLLILRIFCISPFSGRTISELEFEIRPMKYRFGWKKLKSHIYFSIDRHSCDAIFKQEPYWFAYTTEHPISGKYDRLVFFNVSLMQFDCFLLPYVEVGKYNMNLMNFEDSLGLLIWEERDNFHINIWEANAETYIWSKKCKVDVLPALGRILGCLRNGDIVAENEDGLLLFNPGSEVVVQNANNTYPCLFPDMSIVGPVNGYLCLFHPTWSDVITLWNPAMRMSKMVKLSQTKSPQEVQYVVSVGLAFDSQKNDFLILRIFCSCTAPNHVEIEILHPIKSHFGLKNLKSNLHFRIDHRYTCDVIFKGEPYWLAYKTDTPIFGQHEGLVRFDVGKMRFHWLPLPSITAGYHVKYLANFEYSLGMLTWEHRDKCYIDVWIMDDEEYDWSKKYKLGPFLGIDGIMIDGIMRCLRSGNIAAEKHSRKPTFPVKAQLKVTNGAKGSYVIFDCPESLLLIDGMETVKKQDLSEYKRLVRESADFMQTQ